MGKLHSGIRKCRNLTAHVCFQVNPDYEEESQESRSSVSTRTYLLNPVLILSLKFVCLIHFEC